MLFDLSSRDADCGRAGRNVIDDYRARSDNGIRPYFNAIDDRGSGVNVTTFTQRHMAGGHDPGVHLAAVPQHIVMIDLRSRVD